MHHATPGRAWEEEALAGRAAQEGNGYLDGSLAAQRGRACALGTPESFGVKGVSQGGCHPELLRAQAQWAELILLGLDWTLHLDFMKWIRDRIGT